MKPENDSLLTPVTGSDLSSTSILPDESIPHIPSAHEVATSARDQNFIQQIAEPNGLNTCNPTSVLNGFIYQGYISRRQAEAAQQFIVDNKDKFFMTGPMLGRTLTTFAVPNYKLLEVISKTSGATAHLNVIKVNNLSEDQLNKYIISQLLKNTVLVGGDANHAFLTTGYSDNGKALQTRDPLSPHKIRKINTQPFINTLITQSEPYLTLIPQPSIKTQ